MRWFFLLFWLTATRAAARRVRRMRASGEIARAGRACAAFAWALRTALATGMGAQMAALARDGLLTLQTALPLHLCSFSAVVAMLALPSGAAAALPTDGARLLRLARDWLWLLGAPCALLALLFPAVRPTSLPWLTEAGFYQLHAALLCAPLYLRLAANAPLPTDPRPALLAGLLLTACVAGFDRATGCNYLFLLRAPQGTPLAAMAARGAPTYAAALAVSGMALTSALCAGCARIGARKKDGAPARAAPPENRARQAEAQASPSTSRAYTGSPSRVAK